jgi:hypothetical protein
VALDRGRNIDAAPATWRLAARSTGARPWDVSEGGGCMYLLLLILLAVVVVALVVGGIGYSRRGSQNTTIFED